MKVTQIHTDSPITITPTPLTLLLKVRLNQLSFLQMGSLCISVLPTKTILTRLKSSVQCRSSLLCIQAPRDFQYNYY